MITEQRLKDMERRLDRLEAKYPALSDVVTSVKDHADVIAVQLEGLAGDPALTPGGVDAAAIATASSTADRKISGFIGGSQGVGAVSV